MVLKPQDVVVAAKLLGYRDFKPKQSELAAELSLSSSEIHNSLRRLRVARLIHSPKLGGAPVLESIKEFFVHGVKYAFPAQRGELTRGLPTSYAAEPLRAQIAPDNEPPPVWPFSKGPVRGMSLTPLYKGAPDAAIRDPRLYEILALLDALRDGRARERKIAERELLKRLEGLGG